MILTAAGLSQPEVMFNRFASSSGCAGVVHRDANQVLLIAPRKHHTLQASHLAWRGVPTVPQSTPTEFANVLA